MATLTHSCASCTGESSSAAGALPVLVLIFSHLNIPDHQEFFTLNFLSDCVKRIEKGKARGRGKGDDVKKQSLSGGVCVSVLRALTEWMCLSVLRGPHEKKQEENQGLRHWVLSYHCFS